MKFNLKNIALLAALSVLALASCKKESTDSLLNLSGNLWFDAPVYVVPGEVITLTPKGASHPKEDGEYGYYWRTTPATGLLLESGDTTKRYKDDPAIHDGHIVLTIPDTLCTFTIKCMMFAEGYYTSSASADICIVKEESISNIPQAEGQQSFIDGRDGCEYTYVSSCGLDWMNTNLKYAALGQPYEDCKGITTLFGNLYTYDQAETACPEGWRLPTLDEWETLCGGGFAGAAGDLMVDGYFNNKKMWEYWPDVKITNASRMNVLPVGYALVSADEWRYAGTFEFAVLWSSTDYEGDQKCSISLCVDQPDIVVNTSYRDNFAASVRCVRESSK